MFRRILIVCIGNICRSPLAEVLLKERLPNLTINSAGIAVDKNKLSGQHADPIMIATAKSFDLDLTKHRARQLTSSLCDTHDLILVMEPSHIELISQLSTTARHKTLLLGQWSGDATISDPYGKTTADFQLAHGSIERAVRAWARRLPQ